MQIVQPTCTEAPPTHPQGAVCICHLWQLCAWLNAALTTLLLLLLLCDPCSEWATSGKHCKSPVVLHACIAYIHDTAVAVKMCRYLHMC